MKYTKTLMSFYVEKFLGMMMMQRWQNWSFEKACVCFGIHGQFLQYLDL